MIIYSTPQPAYFWSYGLTVVPNSATTILGKTTVLYKLYLSNVTGSPVTVSIEDLSTEASGAPCQVWPAVTLAPNSVQVVNLDGVVANFGVQWSASAANAVHAQISGGY